MTLTDTNQKFTFEVGTYQVQVRVKTSKVNRTVISLNIEVTQ